MVYTIKIPNSIGANFKKDNLVLSCCNKKVSIKINKHFFIRLSKKNRLLRIKSFCLYNLKFSGYLLKRLLPIFNTTIKKIESSIFCLLREPKALVFLVGLGFKLRYNMGKRLIFLKLGYSHSLELLVPFEIQFFSSLKENIFLLRGSSQEKLNSFTYLLQNYKVPDIYKNKGIFLNWQSMRRKKIKKNG